MDVLCGRQVLVPAHFQLVFPWISTLHASLGYPLRMAQGLKSMQKTGDGD